MGECLELSRNLRAGLEPWASPKGRVAELTGERAAPQNLHAAEHVAIGLQQVDAWKRQVRQIGLVLLDIPALVAAPLSVAQELRPGLVRLAHDTERPDPLKDLAHPAALDAHPREAHKLSPR